MRTPPVSLGGPKTAAGRENARLHAVPTKPRVRCSTVRPAVPRFTCQHERITIAFAPSRAASSSPCASQPNSFHQHCEVASFAYALKGRVFLYKHLASRLECQNKRLTAGALPIPLGFPALLGLPNVRLQFLQSLVRVLHVLIEVAGLRASSTKDPHSSRTLPPAGRVSVAHPVSPWDAQQSPHLRARQQPPPRRRPRPCPPQPHRHGPDARPRPPQPRGCSWTAGP